MSLRGLVALVAAVAACGPRDRIVVGAKNFTESDLLAEMVAQQIERRTGLPVERRLHLGGTFVCHQAIVSEKLDVYVEYSGTALTAVLSGLKTHMARGMVLFSLASLVLFVQVPSLAGWLHLAPLHGEDWAFTLAGGLVAAGCGWLLRRN